VVIRNIALSIGIVPIVQIRSIPYFAKLLNYETLSSVLGYLVGAKNAHRQLTCSLSLRLALLDPLVSVLAD